VLGNDNSSPLTLCRFLAKKLLPFHTHPTHQIQHHATLSFFETQDGNKGNETCITMNPAKSRDTFAEFQTTVTIQFDSKLGEVKLRLCSPL
jgi:hypothetical protein